MESERASRRFLLQVNPPVQGPVTPRHPHGASLSARLWRRNQLDAEDTCPPVLKNRTANLPLVPSSLLQVPIRRREGSL